MAHLPLSSTTILPALWSSTYSNSPMYPTKIAGLSVNIALSGKGQLLRLLRMYGYASLCAEFLGCHCTAGASGWVGTTAVVCTGPMLQIDLLLTCADNVFCLCLCLRLKKQLTVLHHHLQELDNHLGGWSDQHLSLAPLLCVVHCLKGIVQDADAHHPAKRAGVSSVQSERGQPESPP